MFSKHSELELKDLPSNIVVGMSFHSQNLLGKLSQGHVNTRPIIFKGELRDQEVVAYMKCLNQSNRVGLELILSDKENTNSEENLWIHLKETTGFQPGSLTHILSKVCEMKLREDIENFIQEEALLKFMNVQDALKVYRQDFFTGQKQNNFFNNFLLSASNSYYSVPSSINGSL